MVLAGIARTLLLPLIGRAFYSNQQKPLIYDIEAIRLFNLFKNDCLSLLKYCKGFYGVIWIARAHYFETEIRCFIKKHPEATIINLGAGLDTTFYRVDNGQINWIDIDLPEVIALRKQYLTPNNRVHDIACSILEKNSWIKQILKIDHTSCLFFAGGLFFYFSEVEVKQILNEIITAFPNATVIFDTISTKQLQKTRSRIEKMKIPNANVQWSIDSINDIKKLLPSNHLIIKHPYFSKIKLKSNFSLFTKLQMRFNDITNKSGFIKVTCNK